MNTIFFNKGKLVCVDAAYGEHSQSQFASPSSSIITRLPWLKHVGTTCEKMLTESGLTNGIPRPEDAIKTKMDKGASSMETFRSLVPEANVPFRIMGPA